jgi:hypothetical protein
VIIIDRKDRRLDPCRHSQSLFAPTRAFAAIDT